MSDLTWQEERDKFWEDFDLWDDKHEPAKAQFHVTYRISLPPKVVRTFKSSMHTPFILYVDVYDGTGEVSLADNSFWFGKHAREMSHEEKKEVYDYLVEQGYAEWQRIGPEDSELFSTDKLTCKEDTPTWEL